MVTCRGLLAKRLGRRWPLLFGGTRSRV